MNETTLILRAACFAAMKHKDQRRKDADSSPYINHPLGLARVLAEEGGITDPATLCAALLHDTIEDTDTTPEELEREFGAEVCALVLEVTDDKSLPKAERKLAQVEHAAHISDKAKRIKLADKICNLRDVANAPPANWTLVRRQEYFDWAKSVIDNLRGVDAGLEMVFDSVYRIRPSVATEQEQMEMQQSLEQPVKQNQETFCPNLQEVADELSKEFISNLNASVLRRNPD